MATTQLNGPFISICTGGTATTPTSCTLSTTPLFQLVHSNNIARRKRPANVMLAPATTYSRERSSLLRTIKYGNYGNQSVGTIVSHATFPTSLGGILSDRGQYRFLEKVKATTWNVGTFVGELPETLNWLGGTVKALWKSYKAVKRGNFRELRRILKRNKRFKRGLHVEVNYDKWVADKWLQWRYAVQPLCYETEDVLKALAETGLKPSFRRVSTHVEGMADSTSSYLGNKSFYKFYRRYRFGAVFSVNPIADNWKRYGSLNVVETLWELTPLSFVVDWFLPIGKAIASLDAEAGVTYNSKWISTFEREDHAISGPSISDGHYKRSSYSRGPNGQGVPIPRYDPHISVTRYLDIVSLISSFRR